MCDVPPKATDFTWYSRCVVRVAARDQGSMAWGIDRETEFTSKMRTVCLLFMVRGMRSEGRANWPH